MALPTLAALRQETLAEREADVATNEHDGREPATPSARDLARPPDTPISKSTSSPRSSASRLQDSSNSSNLSNYQDRNLDNSLDIVLNEIAATPRQQLNVRVPEGVADWFSDRAYRMRKSGVSKESLVTEALVAFIRARLAEEGE